MQVKGIKIIDNIAELQCPPNVKAYINKYYINISCKLIDLTTTQDRGQYSVYKLGEMWNLRNGKQKLFSLFFDILSRCLNLKLITFESRASL